MTVSTVPAFRQCVMSPFNCSSDMKNPAGVGQGCSLRFDPGKLNDESLKRGAKLDRVCRRAGGAREEVAVFGCHVCRAVKDVGIWGWQIE